MYHNRDGVLTPPQSSPESHHNSIINSSFRDFHPHDDHPLANFGLLGNIPQALLCKSKIH